MTNSFSDAAYLAKNPGFIDRVRIAMATAATQIGVEAIDVAANDHLRLRRALAVNVLSDPESWAPKFALAVATNDVIDNTSSDSDIQFTVNSKWDSIAGAGAPPVSAKPAEAAQESQ